MLQREGSAFAQICCSGEDGCKLVFYLNVSASGANFQIGPELQHLGTMGAQMRKNLKLRITFSVDPAGLDLHPSDMNGKIEQHMTSTVALLHLDKKKK